MSDLIIMDFSTAEVHIYKMPNDVEVEDFMAINDFDLDDCYWMIGDSIKIINHTK